MIKNPFPGAQPYRSSDRKLFYGREDLARKLESVILATRCLTVHGPSGAGKSSLVQAAVLPELVDSRDARIVRVDAWPEDEAPDSWLARAVFSELRLGEVPADCTPTEAVLNAAKRAARASDRLVIVYLDQMEQLFFANRSANETDALFLCLQQLVDLPVRALRVVLSLREDYLGRFRDRLRDRGRLLENTFRVGPLTVLDITAAVCQAARAGDPPQEWSFDVMRTLMLQVRLPGQAASDEAEAQAAYAQIVCRALFQERALGQTRSDDKIEAEPILRRYFDNTLSGLGNLQNPARRLLEDHLVSTDGSRTLRTEKELLRILPEDELFPILEALERAAILHAAEHQGSRYFEIGHDWLARKVFEERAVREAREADRKRAEETRREFEEQQKIAAERLEKAREDRRRFMFLASGALAFAGLTSVLGLYAWRARKEADAARRDATRAQLEAVRKRIEASDQRLLSGYAALTSQGNQSIAIKLLPEVKFPAVAQGWLSVASDALSENKLRVTLSGHTGSIVTAQFSPDGKHVLTASSDGTARIWHADGNGNPVLLAGHKAAILSATWSPNGARVLTTSSDGTAHIWNANGQGAPVEINLHAGPIWAGAFSPNGKSIALGVQDGSVRVVPADGDTAVTLALPETNPGGLRAVAFFPDNQRVLGAANNGSVHIWTLDTQDKPIEIGKHNERVESLVVSADGTKVLTAAGDPFAKLFDVKGKSIEKPHLLSCGQGQAIQSALSPDGKLAAVSCNDHRARIFSTIEDKPPIILEGAEGFITDIAFRPDGKYLAISSHDSVARVYSVLGGPARLQLRGHTGAIGVLSFSADGKSLVTGASDDRSKDYTAKIWNVAELDELPPPPRNPLPHHSVAIRLDGLYVAAAFDDNVARLRRVDGQDSSVELKGHTGWISRVAWSPDGTRVVTASFDMTARVWQADGSGSVVILGGKEFDGHTAGVLYARFSPDGSRIVTASEDRTAKVWQANQPGKPLATLGGHEDWVTWATFSPDGQRVATACQDQMVRVYSLDNPSTPQVFPGHRGSVNSVLFSPDGERIASASDDGTVRVMSVRGNAPPLILNGNGVGMMQFAVWSSNGQRIAAASSDHLVYLWNADGSSEPSVLTPPENAIALQFMNDDRTLLAIFADGSSRSWRLDIPGLLEALRNANADCLPAAIRKKFFEETDLCAQIAYEKCEAAHGRGPNGTTPSECEQNSPLDELGRLEAAVKADKPREQNESSIFDWFLAQDPKIPVTPTRPTDLSTRPKSLKEIGPDGCHVRVVVLPGDADVAVDGSPVRRKEGAIELFGKQGDVVRLRVSRGGHYLETDVKIEAKGAVPPVVILPPKNPAQPTEN